MKNLISITIALLLNTTAVFAGSPYMATGMKIGEVTASEAIVWVRLTADEQRVDFGAPMPNSDHAVDAVSAAIDIQRAIAARNQQLGGAGHRVEIGIGIHTGNVVVGTIGSDRRTDFTAVGDAVNVAHRLEKLARPGEILVSEAVQRRVRGTVKLRFEGERQLSGRKEPVHVYSVDPSPPPASAAGRDDHAEPT